MKVSPLLLAAKAGSSKLCLCTDMSFGSPSLNDHVRKAKIRVSYDSLASFAPYMKAIEALGSPLILWKSDVACAYRNIPMCWQWQLRQIILIGGRYHADRCASFGSAASPKIWVSVYSLVLWIAIQVLHLNSFNNLMDDTWGVSTEASLVLFKGVTMPLNQAKLLLLLNYLNFPWSWDKQLSGTHLEIIRHHVKADELSFSLSPEKKAALVQALCDFVDKPAH